MADSSSPAAATGWTDIEHVPPQPATIAGPSRVDRGPGPRSIPLHRHQRPILGAFDAGCATLQRSARATLVGGALFVVPAVVLNVVVSNLVFDRFTSFDDVVVSVPELVGGVDAATGVETVLAFVAILTNSLAVALVGGYLTRLVLHRWWGSSIAIADVVGPVLRRLPALATAWVIGHCWIVLGSLAVVQMPTDDLLPVAVVLAPLIAWLTSLTVLVSPVIVAERLGPLAGLRRAVRLGRSRSGLLFGFVLLCALIGGGLRFMVGALPALIEATGLLTFGRFGGVAEALASQVSQLLTVPMVGLATAHLYLQVRMDAEGMDLVVEGQRVFPA